MSIAVIIESTTTNGTNQTLLVPTATDVLWFHRVATGQRGRASHWQITEGLPEDLVTFEPRAVVITDKDVANAEIGNVTNLAIKVMATPQSPITNGIAHDVLVNEVTTALFEGNSDYLNNLVKDGRRKTPSAIVFTPIGELAPAYFPILAEPVVAPAPAPVVAPAPIASVPVIEPVVTAVPNKPVELAQVPPSKWAEQYLNRMVTKTKSDFDVLDVAMANNQNVLIRGHAGSGKTVCVLGYASARGLRYYNVSANVGLEPSHLFGAWTPTETAGVFKWQDGPVTDLVRHGGVLLLNEIDFMPERITTVLFGLLDDRREIQLLENGGEVIKAHPDLLIVGDHNPNYRGSRPMNQAWKDRFAHKLEFEYDKAIEKKLIGNPALLDVANKLREQAYKGELDTPVSTRGLISFVKNYQNLGLDYAIEAYLNGFLDDEREAVKLVFDTAKNNIAQDFGLTVEKRTLQNDEV